MESLSLEETLAEETFIIWGNEPQCPRKLGVLEIRIFCRYRERNHTFDDTSEKITGSLWIKVYHFNVLAYSVASGKYHYCYWLEALGSRSQ